MRPSHVLAPPFLLNRSGLVYSNMKKQIKGGMTGVEKMGDG